jgi:ornithine cyclodeaminase/alanine dehydrogenase-like protein (mu-crystallin family)
MLGGPVALYLTEQDVEKLLTMDIALEAVEEAFRLQAEGKATNSPRSRLPLPEGAFNLMSAAAPGLGVMGGKAYAVAGNRPTRSHVQLYSIQDGSLLALIEAGRLGQLRTGASSGVATKYMAQPDAATVGVIGAGYQACAQLEAVCRVRNIRRVKVFSRTPDRRERFAAEMKPTLNVEVSAVTSAEDCVRGSDIVITISNSSRPILSGGWLAPGTHINAAGANHRMRRELDDEAVGRADVIVVDDVEQAKIECGDLIYPVERGIIRWEQVRNLCELIAGRVSGRLGANDVTLFESQGLALGDIAAGVRVYQLARQRGLGRELPL